MTPSNANTSGLAPVRWLVTVIATGAQDVHEKPLFDTEFNHKRFTCEPLVTAASAQARIAELEADLSKVIAQRDSHWDEYIAERQSRMEHGAREAGYLDTIPKLTDRATAAEARADRLAKTLEETERYSFESLVFCLLAFGGSVEVTPDVLKNGTDRYVLTKTLNPETHGIIYRAALQQETQK